MVLKSGGYVAQAPYAARGGAYFTKYGAANAAIP
jgi:hypothetical protein